MFKRIRKAIGQVWSNLDPLGLKQLAREREAADAEIAAMHERHKAIREAHYVEEQKELAEARQRLYIVQLLDSALVHRIAKAAEAVIKDDNAMLANIDLWNETRVLLPEDFPRDRVVDVTVWPEPAWRPYVVFTLDHGDPVQSPVPLDKFDDEALDEVTWR